MSNSFEWDNQSGADENSQEPASDTLASESGTSGARPRLRLGDAERIAAQRMAGPDNGGDGFASASGFSGDAGSLSAEITNQLLEALNGSDARANSSPYGGEDRRALGAIPFPSGQGNVAANMNAPVPGAAAQGMGSQNGGLMGDRLGITYNGNQGGRAPVGPMRRATAPQQGLRLRQALNNQSTNRMVAPPISRAESLYELLNRSHSAPRPPRPMRRPAPVQQPQYQQPQYQQPQYQQPQYEQPQYQQQPFQQQPYAGQTPYTSQYQYQDPMAQNANTYAPAETTDEQIAQEVQDAINSILQSVPDSSIANEGTGDERAEALRRVRMLRAQLVGLHSKIAQSTDDPLNQPQAGYQSQYTHGQPQQYATPGQAGVGQQPYTSVHQQPMQPYQGDHAAGQRPQEPASHRTGGMNNGPSVPALYQPGAQGNASPYAQGAVGATPFPIGGQQSPQFGQYPGGHRPPQNYYEPSPQQQGQYGGMGTQDPVSQAASPSYGAETHYSPETAPRQEMPHESAHHIGAYHQGEEADEWQDNQWDEHGALPSEGGLPDLIGEDELPKGIVPMAQEGQSGRSWVGTGAKIAGGLALAASVAVGGVFAVDGDFRRIERIANKAELAKYWPPSKLLPQRMQETAEVQESATIAVEPDNSLAARIARIDVGTPSSLGAKSGDTSGTAPKGIRAENVNGVSDQPIKLVLNVDGAAALKTAVVRIKGVPPGARITGGFDVGDGTWLVPFDKIDAVAMTVPGYMTGAFDLRAQALADDALTTVSDVATFSVTIASQADDRSDGSFTSKGEATDSDVTLSTVDQTVPTASPKPVAVDTPEEEAKDAMPAPVAKPGSAAAIKAETKVAAKSAEPAPSVAKPESGLSKIITVGDTLMKKADIDGARKFYKKAADLGSADAALALGQTYDPVYFEKNKLGQQKADTEQALLWYQEALSRGNDDARSKVDRLLKWVKKGS